MFRHHIASTLAAEAATLLNADFTHLDTQGRWQLVEAIEAMIDRVQRQHKAAPLLSSDRHHALNLLDPLRTRRAEILRSFYSQVNQAVRPAAHGH